MKSGSNRIANAQLIAERCAERFEGLSREHANMSPFQRAVRWYRGLIVNSLNVTEDAIAGQIAEIKSADKQKRQWKNLIGIYKPRWAGWRSSVPQAIGGDTTCL